MNRTKITLHKLHPLGATVPCCCGHSNDLYRSGQGLDWFVRYNTIIGFNCNECESNIIIEFQLTDGLNKKVQKWWKSLDYERQIEYKVGSLGHVSPLTNLSDVDYFKIYKKYILDFY